MAQQSILLMGDNVNDGLEAEGMVLEWRLQAVSALTAVQE